MAVTLRLVIDVEFEENGVSVESLKKMLQNATRHAVNRGFFLSDTPAEIVEWSSSVSQGLSPSERQDLAKYYAKKWGLMGLDEAEGLLEQVRIERVEINESIPGRSGPAFFVLFSGDPEWHDVLIRHEHGNLERVDRCS